jgi:GNAT superfamily N-acetyltransferase
MPLKAIAAAIADPLRIVVVATAGGQTIGWAKTHYWDWTDGPAEAGHYLGGVSVDPQWRRRGVAARLTAERMDWIGRRTNTAWYVVNATTSHPSTCIGLGAFARSPARRPSTPFDSQEASEWCSEQTLRELARGQPEPAMSDRARAARRSQVTARRPQTLPPHPSRPSIQPG